eukprot:sb/3473888/
MGSDYKGITQKILVNGQPVHYAQVWVLDSTGKESFSQNKSENQPPVILPALFCGQFKGPTKSLDTFLDPTDWGHGFVILNGFNLGRYWPEAGPQITLYAPGVYFNQNKPNTLCLLEIDRVPPKLTVSFVGKSNLGQGNTVNNFDF